MRIIYEERNLVQIHCGFGDLTPFGDRVLVHAYQPEGWDNCHVTVQVHQTGDGSVEVELCAHPGKAPMKFRILNGVIESMKSGVGDAY